MRRNNFNEEDGNVKVSYEIVHLVEEPHEMLRLEIEGILEMSIEILQDGGHDIKMKMTRLPNRMAANEVIEMMTGRTVEQWIAQTKERESND